METIKFVDLNDFLDWYEVMSKEYQMPFDRPKKYPCLIAFTPIGDDSFPTDIGFVFNPRRINIF